MAGRGEVEADGGQYELRGPLRERHARQQSARSIPTATDRRWDGTWTAAVVVEDRRSPERRARFRAAATRLKLAELREGTWVRPADLDPARQPDAKAEVDAQATWLTGIRPEEPDRLVAAFDLPGWTGTARDLIAEMAEWQPALDQRDTDALAPTFVVDAAVLRHLVADPALPSALLPDDWPGPELRSALGRFDAAFKTTWRAWYRTYRDV